MGAARTGILFVVMTGLFMAIGWVAGGVFGADPTSTMLTFLAIAICMNVFAYFFSDKLVLRGYGARVVTAEQAPRLHAIVSRLAKQAGVPMPRVASIDSPTPNAFATGRNPKNAVVAATTGILEILDDRELAGVLAHEMAHVRNRDILTSSIAATLAGAMTLATRTLAMGGVSGGRQRQRSPLALVLLLGAPIAAFLLKLGIGRSREYAADADGAHVHGDPLALASALEKLEGYNRARPMLRGNPAAANLFIVNPFRAQTLTALLSTHPPTSERVRRLRAMAGR